MWKRLTSGQSIKYLNFFSLLLEKDLPLLWNKWSLKYVGWDLRCCPDVWEAEISISLRLQNVLGDRGMKADLFVLRCIYITCMWVKPRSLQSPCVTCVRNTFCSLSPGLHLQRSVGDTVFPRRLWNWTFKSAGTGDELINKEVSIYFPLSFLQAESSDITMKPVWSKPNWYY